MRHPFQAISSDRVGKYLFPLILLTLVFMIVLNLLGASLNNPSAPNGIISFELAGEVEVSKSILDSWDDKAQILASFSLGLDYLFLIVYSNTIGLGCIWAMGSFVSKGSGFLTVGLILAWGQWFAALFDAVENAALLKLLFGDLQSPYPEIAKVFAIAKFVLIALGLIYVAFSAIIRIINQVRA